MQPSALRRSRAPSSNFTLVGNSNSGTEDLLTDYKVLFSPDVELMNLCCKKGVKHNTVWHDV